MYKGLVAVLALFMLVASTIEGQEVIMKGKERYLIQRLGHGAMVTCPHTHTPNNVYNPYKRKRTKGVKLSDMIVTYQDFPDEAVEPFEYMISILEELFPSDVPINVLARYVQTNALASAGPTDFVTITGGGLPDNTFFPIPLAEKILERSFNGPGEIDIVVNISNTIDWYYDFENPAMINGRFDFVTVVMHEILHGLGFLSLSDVQGTLGTNQFGVNAFIYDRLLETGDGLNLVDDFENGSFELGAALRSQDLFFASDFFNINTPNDIPEIYAPRSWDEGSSISHLDEETFSQSENGLMTPFAAPNEINHDPGISTDILYDCGWSRTLINRTHDIFEEDVNQDFEFTVEVLSDFGFDTSTLQLFWFEGEFSLFNLNRVDLVPNGETNIFSTTLEAIGEPRTINYYYSVRDNRNISVSNPFSAPQVFYSFTWGQDTIKPEISHVPIERINENESELQITATLTDQFTGIDTAFAVISLTGQDDEVLPLLPAINDFNSLVFEGTYTFPRDLDTLDVLSYRIEAVDASSLSNVAVLPETGRFVIDIIPIPRPILTYLNDFNDGLGDDDFIGEGFSVREEDGFDDAALHSLHPYGDAASRGVSQFNLTYQLRNPIIVSSDNDRISFDEIALVEPGELGVPFPESEFWDYVVVEGRQVSGTEWIPFINGYDARSSGAWLDAYNSDWSPCPEVSNIPECISNATGNQTLYQARRLNITDNENFIAGDTILVRFRLFSDPAAFGWGWVIDNLSIQDVDITTNVIDIAVLDEQSITPNPSSGSFVVNYAFDEAVDIRGLRVLDMNGRLIHDEEMSASNTTAVTREIITAGWTPGLYIVEIATNQGVATQKAIII
ncbi:MAG: T9SS type A sorting domain-containing protein [Bacteroidota bacterium]